MEKNTQKNSVLVPLNEACEILGLSKQALYYRLQNNIDNIGDFCVVVYWVEEKKETFKYNELDNSTSCGRRKRYFLQKEFLDSAKKKTRSTPEEEEEFSRLYYSICEIIEFRLEKEHRSIATEKQRWANSKIVDLEIQGEIFARYEERHGVPLSRSEKSDIRFGIKNFMFPSGRLLRISIIEMREILKELKGEQ